MSLATMICSAQFPKNSFDVSLKFSRGGGGGCLLESAQFLPVSREDLFAFFSDAFQLQTLTPDFLDFQVLTPPPIVIRQGTLIDYRLRWHGVPLRWRSEITVFEPPYRFVDVQRRGPYRRWRHEHTFEPAPGGTICRDRVEYAVWGGRWLEKTLVRRDLQRIFVYRQKKLSELFSQSYSLLPAADRGTSLGAGFPNR